MLEAPTRRILAVSFGFSFALIAGLIIAVSFTETADAASYATTLSGLAGNWTTTAWSCNPVAPGALTCAGAYPGSGGVDGDTATISGAGAPLTVNSNIANAVTLNLSTAGLTIATGGTLRLIGSSALSSGTLFVNGGTLVNLTGAQLNLNAVGTPNANLTLASGTINNAGQIFINGGSSFGTSMTWSGGTLTGGGSLNIQSALFPGALTLNGGQGVMTLDGATINNNATTTYSAPVNFLNIINGATFQNAGTFNASSDAPINGSTGGRFNNASQFIKGGGLSTAINVPFNNTGSVSLPFSVQVLSLNQGGIHNNATWGLGAGAQLNFNGGTPGHTFFPTQSFTGTASSVQFTGGTISVQTDMAIPFPLTNMADLRLGNVTPNSLTLVGSNYTQTAAGSLMVVLAGTAAGQFSQLNVGGTATLAGALSVLLLYTPANGDTFNIMPYASRTGTLTYTPVPYPGGKIIANYTPIVLQLIAAPEADIFVTKSGPVGPIATGQNATFTVSVTNNGPSAATSIVITDSFSGGSFVSADPICTGTGPLTCTIATLAPAATTSFNVTLSASAPGTLSNTATRSTSTPTDPNSLNDTGSASVGIIASANLSITKTDSPDPVAAGAPLLYSIVVTNNGPNPVSTLTVTDTLPVGVGAGTAGGPQWSCGPVAGTFTCTWTGGAAPLLPAVSTAPLVVNVTAPTAGGSITNTASVSSGLADPVSGNNSASATTTVTATADLALVKSGPASVTAGQSVTYTIAVTNNGPSNIVNAVVADSPAASLTFASATAPCSGGFPCVVPTLNSGQTVTFTATFTVSPTATGSVTNTASVSASGTTDPVSGNDSSSSTAAVVVSSDVGITKGGPTGAAPGQTITYTITVINLGPSLATNVTVNDPTPAGTTFVSGGATCPAGFPCSLGSLSPGTSVTITPSYQVNAGATGSISNTATVTSSTSDPNSANNSATDTATVAPATSADLEITKRLAGTATAPNVAFTITVRNLGPAGALNVVVNDPTPTGLTFVSNSGACTTPFPCNLGSFPAGTTRTINSTYTFSGAASTIINTASVSSSTPDPKSSNNSSSVKLTNPCPTGTPTQVNPNEDALGVSANGTINWTDVGGSYEVYLGPAGSGCNTLFATTSSSFVSYSGLLPGQEYESRIVADGPGCPSFSSRCIKWRVAGGTCTLQPPQLTEPPAGANRPSPVRLAWTAVAGADLYTIFVGLNGAAPTQIGSTADTFFMADIPNGSVVWYVVASQRGCANTARSANGTFDSCNPPATPLAGVEGAPISGVAYSVVWDAVSGAVRYEVDEADNAGFAGATTQSTTNTRIPFNHPTVGAPRAFFYRVRAFGTCTNVASANSRTVRVVILPATPTASVNVPKGTTRIKHTIFIPGEPDGPYDFIATTDNPRATVAPPAGVLLQHPGGANFEVEFDLRDLGDGTFTITVILNLIPRNAGTIVTHAVTSKSQPVSVNLVTPVKPGDVSAPTADTLIIPSVGHLAGINSLWRSDIRVLNTGSQKARYQLDFITSGATDVKQTIIEVDTNSTTALDDIVHNWFGFGEVGDSANGILQIRPLNTSGPGPTAVTSQLTTAASSRTYSTSANGTLGQFIPAMPFAGFIGRAPAGAAASILSLQQLAQSSIYRTNVGVVEAAGKPVSVVLSVFNSGGTKLADVPLDLKAGEQRQLNGFLATQGITLDDARIEVRVTDGDGKVTAYASVIDNRSIDPLLVPAVQVGGTTAQRYVLPGVADLNTGSASWRTDMRIFNGGSTPQSATLTFHPLNNASAPLSTNVTVNPGEVRVLNGVLDSLFGARDVGGAIHVLTAGNSQLTVTGRTYNQTSNGTFGQFIPAVTLADAADRTSRALHILQVEDSVRFRTNIGIAEVTGNAAVVEVTVSLPESKVTPKVEIPLAANEFRQFAIIKELGLQNVYNARVTVKVISGNGAVTAYGSVVDMLTSDPTYVPAQ